jgi:hypothetical protein
MKFSGFDLLSEILTKRTEDCGRGFKHIGQEQIIRKYGE